MFKESFVTEPNIKNNQGVSYTEKNKNIRENTYASIDEASLAVQKLGITGQTDYNFSYKKDPLLPSNPEKYYKESFPGWKKFLGTGFYETWAESVEAAKKLGIKSFKDYKRLRYLDPKLRSNPDTYYKDFEWKELSYEREYYKTWGEALEAAKKIGIKSIDEYNDINIRKQDPCLRTSVYQYSDYKWEKDMFTFPTNK